MAQLLTVLLSFPTVFFTGLTALALLYWLFVIVGALDIDALGGAHGAEHGAEGAIDAATGAVKGAFEGAVGAAKGGFEGAGHHVDAGGHDVDGGGDGDVDADAEAGILSFLRLRDAPVTVVASLFALFGLLMTGFYGLTFGVPGTFVGLGVLLATMVLSTVLTSLAIRPIAPAFKTHAGAKSTDFVGKIATVATGRVTDKFGQANLDDGGAGQILEIRDTDKNDLKRGDKVVLVYWDREREAYEVEKVPDLDEPRARIGGGAASAEPADDPEPAGTPERKRA